MTGAWIEKALREGNNGKTGVVLVHWYVREKKEQITLDHIDSLSILVRAVFHARSQLS